MKTNETLNDPENVRNMMNTVSNGNMPARRVIQLIPILRQVMEVNSSVWTDRADPWRAGKTESDVWCAE